MSWWATKWRSRWMCNSSRHRGNPQHSVAAGSADPRAADKPRGGLRVEKSCSGGEYETTASLPRCIVRIASLLLVVSGDMEMTAQAKRSWSVIASNDRALPPELEKAEAASIGATSITLPSGHLVMLTHPKEVADVIEKAAMKGNSR